MKRLTKKKALILLWFMLINYAFMGWAASCGVQPLPLIPPFILELLLLGSVRAAAVVVFFIRPLDSDEDRRSYMRFALLLIILIYGVWLFLAGGLLTRIYEALTTMSLEPLR